MSELTPFQRAIVAGIPSELPPPYIHDDGVSHAPDRKAVTRLFVKNPDAPETERKVDYDKIKLAVKNALRYFPVEWHATLAPEFAEELKRYGRIYMMRFRPTDEDSKIYARPIDEYPGQCEQAKAIMLMIQNNLDPRVAQHPHELITYGGNGTVFQNWAQYLLTMQYLSQMTDHQTLVLYSGHPMGLFPSSPDAPRLVVTNGMMIPNYSTSDDYDRLAALGVTSYGQMTAGSFMYIGPQGIVHGTTITLLNAGRKYLKLGTEENLAGKLFVTSGLGGMSGAQAKAAEITGAVVVIAELNEEALLKREKQGWLREHFVDGDEEAMIERIRELVDAKEAGSIGYLGNVVKLWRVLYDANVRVDLGSDQTSLHLPYDGGYYPIGDNPDAPLTYEQCRELMKERPNYFKRMVQESLKEHVRLINLMVDERKMRFWDYGNAFLKMAEEIGADILKPDGTVRYFSYVEDIMGPMCFDYGFGPFRWVCCSGDPKDLETTDRLAAEVFETLEQEDDPEEVKRQIRDNLHWIRTAGNNLPDVGSKARILYSNWDGRQLIAEVFNQAVADGRLKGPVVMGRDHHDVSGTDSPYRETANIYDGSNLCADMAIHNVIGDAIRGATWVSIHNGGGVGWGEVINGGFGLLLDGTPEATRRAGNMLNWDVANGLARRAWAGNPGAQYAVQQAMSRDPSMQVTVASAANPDLVSGTIKKVFGG